MGSLRQLPLLTRYLTTVIVLQSLVIFRGFLPLSGSSAVRMFIRIEKGSAVPVSRQIADQIATLCVSGTLSPGDRLPSVRELARELAVNQNTVLRVYERLWGEGLLEMRHGQGTFVAAKSSGDLLAMHRGRLVDELRQIARQAIGLGLSTEQLHELLAEAANGAIHSQSVAANEEPRR